MTSQLPSEPEGTLPARTFLFVEAFAFVMYAVLGRSLWFRLDEWQFLADRTAWGRDSLLAPHGWVHPQVLPVLAYRLLWWLVGLRTYRPYLLLIIVMHLTCAFLIRSIMLRSGVRPWTATVVTSVFVLFGTGYQCIVWPFQIGYVGSLLFGLTHLLLADHDGGWDRRDAIGLLAGLASLSCSAVGVTMVATVAVGTLLRRGWKISLLTSAPLGAVYVLWFELFARKDYKFGRDFGFIRPRTPTKTVVYVVHGILNSLHELGQSIPVGAALGVLVLGGLLLAGRGVMSAEVRARISMPSALAAGMVAYLLSTGYGNQGGVTESRYVYIATALFIPAVGVAASALVDRSRALGAIVLAALAIGVPGNVHTVWHYVDEEKPIQSAFKNMMLMLPRVPAAREVPGTQIPITGPYSKPGHVTADWLAKGVESGRIPKPHSTSAADVASATLRWALRDDGTCIQCAATHKIPKRYACVNVARVTEFHLSQPTRLLVKGGSVALSPLVGPLRRQYPLVIQSGALAEALSAQFPVSFRAVSPSRTAVVCTHVPKRGLG